MPIYGISIYGTVGAMVEVEAENYEDACELAIEHAPQTSFGFAKFDGVEDWETSEDGYVVDGEWVFPKNEEEDE